MYNKLILWLLKKKFKLKNYEFFRFRGQKSEAFYWFSETGIIKGQYGETRKSDVSLNWLLDPECDIYKINDK